MADRRQKERQKLKKTNAFALAKEQKESGGGESTCIRVPEGFEDWRPEEGVYELDVMNYVVGKHNRWADEGMLHYECEFQQHWVPTIDGKARPYVCPTRYKKKCPVCERFSRPHEDDDKEWTARIRAKTMHLMQVHLLKKDGKALNEDKFRLWVANHYNKGKGLFEQLLVLISGDEQYGEFADWENGLSLRINFAEDTFPGGKYLYASRIDFIPRKKQYDSDEVLEKLCCLDDCLIEKSYARLKSVLENGVEEEEEDAEPLKPSSGANGKKPSDHEEEDEDQDDETTGPELEKGDWILHKRLSRCQVVKVNRDGSVDLEDKAGRTHKGVDADECDPLGDDDEPKEEKKPAKASSKKSEAEDDDEDDGWEDADSKEEEEEKPKSKAKRK